MSDVQRNTVFHKNMEAFLRHYPDCAEKVANREYERDDRIQIDAELSYSGETILIITKENKKYYLSGKYAPEYPLLDWSLSKEKINNDSVVFLIGMGNWLQIKTFFEEIKKKVTIILYEPCVEVFEKVMECYDVAEIIDKYNVALVIEGINESMLNDFFMACIHRETMAITKTYISGNYLPLFPKKTKEAVQTLKKFLEQLLVTWATIVRYTDVIGENVFNNICYFYHGYNTLQLKGILPQGMPAVIVSAGPSLNKNIKGLKKMKDKCCIIATDTAMKPLLKEGIQPHFITIVDGKKPALLFEHSNFFKSVLVTSTVVAKDVMNLHKGKKVFYSDGNCYNEAAVEAINEERGEDAGLTIVSLLTGGSVANSAFSFAISLGAKTLILVGQDLAMTGNKTHADGTFKEKMDDIDLQTGEYFEVESIDGGKVLTRADFDHYRKWFEERIEAIAEEGIRVIDATEGGAKIHGAEIMTLQDALLECCKEECDVWQKINEMPEMLTDTDKSNLLKYFSSTEERLEEVKKKAKNGITYYKKMIELSKKQNLNADRYLKLYHKVKKINEFMENDKTARFVLENLEQMQNAILSTINIEKEDERDERIFLAQKGKLVLETMLPMIDTLIKMANDTVMQYQGDDNFLYEKYPPKERNIY